MSKLMSKCLWIIIEDAIRSFGSEKAAMFNTAGVQVQFERRFPELGMSNSEGVQELLEAEPRIVRLRGGAHWIVLPNGMERFVE